MTRSVWVVAAVVGLTTVLGGCQSDQQQEAVPATASVDGVASSAPVAATSVATAAPVPVVAAASTPAATAAASPTAAIAEAVKRDPDIAPDAVVVKITISSIDSTWAYAGTDSPTAGGAQVVLHQTGGAWNVVSLGSSEVGCGDGVPDAVMAEFGLGCPS